MMASVTVATVLVFYLAVLLGIGWWGGRESGEVSGYYVAGKKLPWWVIAFSSNATGESAWLLLGLTGMAYLVGAHAFWVVLGEVLGVTLSWVLVARPFKEYTDRYDSITVPDFLEDRFRDSAHVLRIVSAIIIFSMAAVYVAAQLTASGRAFESFLGTTYELGVLIGAAIILYYTTIGGFKAVAYSDVVQGILMVSCLIVLPIVGDLGSRWLDGDDFGPSGNRPRPSPAHGHARTQHLWDRERCRVRFDRLRLPWISPSPHSVHFGAAPGRNPRCWPCCGAVYDRLYRRGDSYRNGRESHLPRVG